MTPYSKPVLRDLGQMSSVTRKSGGETDIDGFPAGSDLPPWQQLLCRFYPFSWCPPAATGGGSVSQTGTGPFQT